MLNGIHFLLTYTCNFECDHCFLYCSPWSKGTFTIGQVTRVLDEARKIGTVEWIFFEGGEPFLFYPLLLESVRRAAQRGFKVGIVTNAYGAISEDDAELWLKPLAEAGLSYLGVSNDQYHYGEASENPATIAHQTAKRLGLDTAPISIEAPEVIQDPRRRRQRAAGGRRRAYVPGAGCRKAGRWPAPQALAGLARMPLRRTRIAVPRACRRLRPCPGLPGDQHREYVGNAVVGSHREAIVRRPIRSAAP